MPARRSSTLAILIACGAAAAAPAGGDRPASDRTKPIDAKPVLDKLELFRDDAGAYLVAPRHGAFADSNEEERWIFAGDGKAMYQQRVIGGGYSPDSGASWVVWSPRSQHQRGAFVDLGKLQITCHRGKGGSRALTPVKADEAKALLARATFYPPLWQREAHRLARDDDAVYYYIDALRDEYGGNGFRVFVGPAGAMKQRPMTNIAQDSAGEIFATKTGQLKFVVNDRRVDDNTVERNYDGYWVRSGKREPLTVLPVEENLYLIYRDLGIYGVLGTPCDDY